MKRILIIVLPIILIAGLYYYFFVLHKTTKKTPDGAVSLEFPLKDGTFEIIQSGRFWNVHTLPVEKYALDIAKPVSIKSFFKFRKADLASDMTFGTPIYSPCRGNIKEANHNFPDLPTGISGQANEINRIIIACDGFDVMLGHIKQDSLLTSRGDIVNVGQKIAEIGNNGKSSSPHLHFMAFRTDAISGEKIPLPMTFGGRYLSRGETYP
jgi:murein DD-endopeptidase MepM/ murein hydrolase activator NlpD